MLLDADPTDTSPADPATGPGPAADDARAQRRGRLAVVAGGLLAVLDLGLVVQGFPLSDALHLLGGLLAGWGCYRAGARGAAIAAAVWSGLEGVDLLGYLPQHWLTSALGWAAALAAAVLYARERREQADERGWEPVAQAWRLTERAALVCWGLPLLSALVMGLAAWLGQEIRYQSHHIVAVGLMWAWLSLPLLALARATARERLTRADDEGRTPGRLARAGAHPAGLAALLALLLTPVWLLVPMWVHYETTPDFAAYLDQVTAPAPGLPALPEGARVIERAERSLQRGALFEIEETEGGWSPDGAAPEANTARYTVNVQLYHGEERLLDLSQELLVCSRDGWNTVQGLRLSTPRVHHDPRFAFAGRLLLDARTLEAWDGQGTLELPLRVAGSLGSVAEPAPPRLEVALVEGLAADEDALTGPFQGRGLGGSAPPELAELIGGGPARPAQPWLSLPSLELVGDGPPPPEEGLSYSFELAARVHIEPKVTRGDGVTSGGMPYVSSREDLQEGSREYSARWLLEARLEHESSWGGSSSITNTIKRKLERKYNDEVW